MRTRTEQYQFAHGRKPSGRGTWFFEVHLHSGTKVQASGSAQRTLTEARREVLSQFQPGTVRELVVLP